MRAAAAKPGILVADFGGTYARAAVARPKAGGFALEHLRSDELRAGQSPADWLAAYCEALGAPRFAACAVCAAGPLEDEHGDALVRFTNRGGEVRASSIARASGCAQAQVINDFAAVAYALPVLGREALAQIGAGTAVEGAPQLAIGPGTGLGVAIRVPEGDGRRARVLPGEGGHSPLAPFDGETARLWPRLAGARAQLSAEDVLSGPGLQRLYLACAAETGVSAADLEPETIAQRGLAQDDLVCARAVRLFTRWLGHFAGGLALVAGARGGVYFSGGILPAWGERIDRAGLRAAFEAQTAQRDYVKSIPTFLIQHPHPALAGLAALAAGT